MEPLLKGHPYKSPIPLEGPLDTVNLYINVLISTPDERPSLFKGHFSGEKGWPHKRGSTVYSKKNNKIGPKEIGYHTLFLLFILFFQSFVTEAET